MNRLSAKLFGFLRSTRRGQLQYSNSERYLELLGKYEDLLSDSALKHIDSQKKQQHEQYDERHFQNRVGRLFKDLCSLGTSFWYDSACLWLLKEHQDRGEILLPSATFNFPQANEYKLGIDASTGFLGVDEPFLLPSAKYQSSDRASATPGVSDINVPSAFVPLRNRHGKRIGVLALHGKEHTCAVSPQDIVFLRSLGSIISNAMEQWEARFKASAQAAMDELFKSNSLDELWQRAARIMKEYLSASGCMVIFRPDPESPSMRIVAREGFNDSIYDHNHYEVGKGQTGKCALTGKTIKYDDVARHKDGFDAHLLGGLEKAHGGPILSWLAIPIGPAQKNYGVIKVVNPPPRWFTIENEQLGVSLSLRLQVIIEKFLQIEKISLAMEEAHRQSEFAKQQAEIATEIGRRAEEVAKKRQEDLMVITHQLQGPLSSVIGAVSAMQHQALSRQVAQQLEHIEDLVEDSLTLCYGTFTSFALEAGRKSSFISQDINAPAELRKLCMRLQKTNARQDLSFDFYEEPGFPTLQMDHNIFVSVMYSLIHNAMKYADSHTHVILECSFERTRREPALKVKSYGEPIQPFEVEKIFQKFRRGTIIEKSGRHHRGTGLGLWVARELIRAIGGDLTVEISHHDPRSSIFIVHLPEMTYS